MKHSGKKMSPKLPRRSARQHAGSTSVPEPEPDPEKSNPPSPTPVASASRRKLQTHTWDLASWMNHEIWQEPPSLVQCFLRQEAIWEDNWASLNSVNLRRVSWGWLTEHQDRITPPPKPTTIPSPNLPTVQQDPNIPTLIAEFQAQQAKVNASITQQQELRRSLEFTQGRQDELINQLQETKRTPARAHTEAASSALVITGLVPGEAETAADAVKSLLTDHLKLPQTLTQDIQDVIPITVTREAKEGEKPRSPKVIVNFNTPAIVNTILRNASRLKEENGRRKAANEFTIGIERQLTKEERIRRNALWGQFKEARSAGKAAHWRGARLFIEGGEVLPPQ